MVEHKTYSEGNDKQSNSFWFDIVLANLRNKRNSRRCEPITFPNELEFIKFEKMRCKVNYTFQFERRRQFCNKLTNFSKNKHFFFKVLSKLNGEKHLLLVQIGKTGHEFPLKMEKSNAHFLRNKFRP